MKITSKKTKDGATVSVRATSQADRTALTDAVMSGRLIDLLNGLQPATKASKPKGAK